MLGNICDTKIQYHCPGNFILSGTSHPPDPRRVTVVRSTPNNLGSRCRPAPDSEQEILLRIIPLPCELAKSERICKHRERG